jgi:hypothetical protein
MSMKSSAPFGCSLRPSSSMPASCATLRRRPERYWLLARNAAIALMSSSESSSAGMCVLGRR